MTYYEELGLAESATTEEIHQAYRNLARLLHPDQQTNDTLRRLAESQMKRINHIHEILSDPAARRQYDLSLRPECANLPGSLVPLVERRSGRPLNRPVWLNTSSAVWGLIAVIVGVSFYIGLSHEDESPVPVSSPSQEHAESTHRLLQSSPTGLTPATRRTTSRQPAKALEGSPAGTDDSTPALETPPNLRMASASFPPVMGDLTPHLRAPAQAAAAAARQTAAPPRIEPPHRSAGFAGTWVYVHSKDSESEHDLYPPEYIETVISEQDGMVHGRYRARYAVKDRAISPEVRLRFTGEATRNAAHLKWTGAGGARGDIQLRLVSEHSLEVNWVADELGTQMGLISGTAVLTRREEP